MTRLSESKACKKCLRVLPRSDFYPHPRMADGLLSKCRDCARQDVKANREARADYYRQYDRQRGKAPQRRAVARERSKVYRQRAPEKARERLRHERQVSPEKYLARQRVRRAIAAGKLTRLPCERCGAPRTHGHHESYDRPLDVVWLCGVHHAERHAEMRAHSEVSHVG